MSRSLVPALLASLTLTPALSAQDSGPFPPAAPEAVGLTTTAVEGLAATDGAPVHGDV